MLAVSSAGAASGGDTGDEAGAAKGAAAGLDGRVLWEFLTGGDHKGRVWLKCWSDAESWSLGSAGRRRKCTAKERGRHMENNDEPKVPSSYTIHPDAMQRIADARRASMMCWARIAAGTIAGILAGGLAVWLVTR
jgi:hypothetical protein